MATIGDRLCVCERACVCCKVLLESARVTAGSIAKGCCPGGAGPSSGAGASPMELRRAGSAACGSASRMSRECACCGSDWMLERFEERSTYERATADVSGGTGRPGAEVYGRIGERHTHVPIPRATMKLSWPEGWGVSEER